MNVQDYIELGFLAVWIVCIVGIIVGSHIHFKNRKAEQYRVSALSAMRKWVAFYDKQDMEDPDKASASVNDAVKELRSKGYGVTDQQVKDLMALREWVLTQLRMRQAETGLDNTVKATPEISDHVDPKDVVNPPVVANPEKGVTANGN